MSHRITTSSSSAPASPASSPPTARRNSASAPSCWRKSTEDKYICNSRYAYGTFHINFTGLDTPEDALVAKIDAATAGFARKDLARAVAKDGRRLMQWLKSEGIDLVNLGGYGTNVLSPPWRTGFGLTWQNYGADIALQRLEANFLKRQGRILRGTAPAR